jgi:TatD DNase family protein
LAASQRPAALEKSALPSALKFIFTIMLIDTHCHLDSSRFKNDLPEVVERALEAGVTRIITIGCDVESSRRAIAIAEQYPQIFCTVGVHPCYVMDVTEPDWLEQITDMAAHPKVVAIGEIGLDYYHNPPEGTSWETYKERQRDFFHRQMELAVQCGKNIVVHQRNSFADSVAMVQKFEDRLRAQFHCFINTWEDAVPLVERGHVISFTGISTYPKAPEVLACAVEATAGNFMVETDAPYLTPQAQRGQRCEPAHVRFTAEAIAQARGISLEALAAVTNQCAETFFRLPTV